MSTTFTASGIGSGARLTVLTTCSSAKLAAGNVRQMRFPEIWEKSELFQQLRRVDDYRGKCHSCQYRKVCGGCRARAYALTGDVLAEDPICPYEPIG